MMFIGAVGLALLVGCQGTPRYGGGFHDAEGPYKTERASRNADNPTIASMYAVDPIAMGAVIDKYIGRPAQSDGKTMDCSEFVDQVYSEQVFDAFENETGIRVMPVYDVEAAKTTDIVGSST